MATYYVAKTGNDGTGDGSFALPWLTIGHAEDVARAGDTVYVRAGTYNERISFGYSGTAGNWINFSGYPWDAKPVCRGFTIPGRNYLRIIGFEVTHIDASYSFAIQITSASDHIQILNNYFHHTYAEGGQYRAVGVEATNIVIRGNEFYMASSVPGVSDAGNGWACQNTLGDHILVEYNHMHRVGDFVNLYSHEQIVRNNYMHDYQDAYWPGLPPDALHCDMFQPCGNAGSPCNNHVYESNWTADNIELNSHWILMQDSSAIDHDIIVRGNVANNFGGAIHESGSVDRMFFFNNTFKDMNTRTATGHSAWFHDYTGLGDHCLGNFIFNNVYCDTGSDGLVVYAGSVCTKSNNLGHSAGADASYASTADPVFTNEGTHDYTLQVTSPAIGLGMAITTVTSASGSGTSFDVADASCLCDGFGIAEGDLIKVGSNSQVRITDITGSTITVATSQTWTVGDSVYWRNQDATVDAGAYEYRAAGYGVNLTLNLIDGQGINPISQTITPASTTPELVRFVEIFIDGIPVSIDYDSPYSYVWDTSGLVVGSTHKVVVRAYHLYASVTMYEEIDVDVGVGTGTANPWVMVYG